MNTIIQVEHLSLKLVKNQNLTIWPKANWHSQSLTAWGILSNRRQQIESRDTSNPWIFASRILIALIPTSGYGLRPVCAHTTLKAPTLQCMFQPNRLWFYYYIPGTRTTLCDLKPHYGVSHRSWNIHTTFPNLISQFEISDYSLTFHITVWVFTPREEWKCRIKSLLKYNPITSHQLWFPITGMDAKIFQINHFTNKCSELSFAWFGRLYSNLLLQVIIPHREFPAPIVQSDVTHRLNLPTIHW